VTTASINEFRSLARQVGNWGRWGPDDEVGKLNLISEEHVREATASVRRGAVVPLGIDLGSDVRQAGLHFRGNSVHVMTVDGGDTRGKAGVAALTGRSTTDAPGRRSRPTRCCPVRGHPHAAHRRGEAEPAVRPLHQLGLLSPLLEA